MKDETLAPMTTTAVSRTHPSSLIPHPSPSWRLTGEAIAFFDGRGLAMLVNYRTSPVGPYHEVARIGLTPRGPKVVLMQVDSAATQRGGRRNWGFPKTLAQISWQRRGARIEVRANGQTLRWLAAGPSIPIRLRASTVQRLRGAHVRVPLTVSGRVRLAWRGRQLGVLLDDMTLVVEAPEAT